MQLFAYCFRDVPLVGRPTRFRCSEIGTEIRQLTKVIAKFIQGKNYEIEFRIPLIQYK